MSNEANKDQQTTRHSVDDFLSEFYELTSIAPHFVKKLIKSEVIKTRVDYQKYGENWLEKFCDLWLRVYLYEITVHHSIGINYRKGDYSLQYNLNSFQFNYKDIPNSHIPFLLLAQQDGNFLPFSI